MPHQSEAGRALPALVLEQLVAALPRLEQASRRVFRVAVQLLIDSGRRPDEVCALRWDCLEQDGDGKHSLVYSDYKNRHRGRRLAIADQTAKLIGEQQQMVRAQFPDTPTSELALLPTTRRNPNGTRPITQGWLARIHRDWVDGLPELLRIGSSAERSTGPRCSFTPTATATPSVSSGSSDCRALWSNESVRSSAQQDLLGCRGLCRTVATHVERERRGLQSAVAGEGKMRTFPGAVSSAGRP